MLSRAERRMAPPGNRWRRCGSICRLRRQILRAINRLIARYWVPQRFISYHPMLPRAVCKSCRPLMLSFHHPFLSPYPFRFFCCGFSSPLSGTHISTIAGTCEPSKRWGISRHVIHGCPWIQ